MPHRKLVSAWRRERRFVQLRGLYRFTVCALCACTALFLTDWNLDLPGWTRVGLAAIGLGFLVVVLYRTWWRHLRRFDALRTALRVEGLYPELQSILVSHVQLSPGHSDLAGASPRLVEAMRARARETVRPLDFGAIVRFEDLRPLAVAAGLTLVGFLGSMALTPSIYGVFLQRMLDPSGDLAYPTRTQIETTTGDLVVQQGSVATLEAWADGVVPDEGRVFLRQEGGIEESFSVPRSNGVGVRSLFRLETAELYRGFTYRFEIGDARSPERRVVVVPAPRLTTRAVRMRYPAYTALPDRVVDSLNVSILAGTRLEWALEFDAAIETLDVIDGAGDVLKATSDGRTFTFERTVDRPFDYQLRWRDLRHGFIWEGGVRYSVRVETDHPPRVELRQPREDQVGTQEKVVEIEFTAMDDYGLAEAWLVYRRNDDDEGRERLAVLAGAALPEPFRATWKPRASIASLAEGDSLTFAVEVSDNRFLSTATGDVPANTTRSRPRRLKILSVTDYLKYLGERKSHLFSNVGGILREEADGSETIKELKELTP